MTAATFSRAAGRRLAVREPPAWRADLREVALAFAIILPLLFAGQITWAGPALSFGFLLIYAATRRRELISVLTGRWLLLLVVAYALASTLWSAYPDVTLKHAAELAITCVGALVISGSRRLGAFLVGTWAAFALFLGVSLVLGHSRDTAFTGLNSGKNLFGMTAATGAILSLFVLSAALRRGSLAGVALAAPALAAELYLVAISQSAGATIGFLLAAAAFAIFATLGAFGPKLRGIVCGGVVMLLAAGGLWGYAFARSITTTALDLLHKDPGLTGRDYLWYRASEFIRERPLLGRGFEAFWVRGDPDAEGLWQYAQLPNRSGFNFHSTMLELLVHFGVVGAALTIGVFVAAVFFLLRRSVRQPSLICAVLVALVTFHVSRTAFESLMPTAADFATLLLFVALGYGFGAPAVATEASASRGPAGRADAWRRVAAVRSA